MPPQAAQSHTVLVMGDSIMGQTLSGFSTVPTLLPEATFIDEHRNTSGLLTPIASPPPLVGPQPDASPYDFVRYMLDKYPQADTVFVEWTGACVSCPYEYGSQAFYDAWWAAVQQIKELILSYGKTLVWAISPPEPPVIAPDGTATAPPSDVLSWGTRARLADLPRADLWAALCVDDGFLGHYAQWLYYFWWPEYRNRQVRADDFAHFTPDGAVRAAFWSTVALRKAWGG